MINMSLRAVGGVLLDRNIVGFLNLVKWSCVALTQFMLNINNGLND